MSYPLVSCLMVTRNRAALSRLAIDGFLRQTYPNLELIVVDDGHEDYEPILPPSRPGRVVHYVKLPDQRRTLGELRNLSMMLSSGNWWVQWDDDEWYHRERVAVQMEATRRAGATGCALRWTLMHINTPDMRGQFFRADAGFATPGTILHRRTSERYPPVSRGEDSEFIKLLRAAGPIVVLGREASHLFVRNFHGGNTWDVDHFRKRLRRQPGDWPSFFAAAFIRREITSHRRFVLDEREAAASVDARRDLNAVFGPNSARTT